MTVSDNDSNKGLYSPSTQLVHKHTHTSLYPIPPHCIHNILVHTVYILTFIFSSLYLYNSNFFLQLFFFSISLYFIFFPIFPLPFVYIYTHIHTCIYNPFPTLIHLDTPTTKVLYLYRWFIHYIPTYWSPSTRVFDREREKDG